MKWTRDEIAKHADRLADRFEDFDPAETMSTGVRAAAAISAASGHNPVFRNMLL